MATKVAINGFGRIGRLVARAILSRTDHDLELVSINDLGDAKANALLFKRDSVHGNWQGDVSVDGDFLVIDGKRIAVTGGSYGGYMTLASMLRYGDRLKAGLEVVGISSFVTFLENTQAYRRDLRRAEYGDERLPEQRSKLEEISPLGRASEIDIPLMVVTGENDPRVPESEAEQIVSAVRANGQPAWHLLAGNEGHGFRKKANADYQFWASLLFWQKYLLDETQ